MHHVQRLLYKKEHYGQISKQDNLRIGTNQIGAIMSWFRSIFTDGTDDGISSKRVVTILAFLMCSAGFIGDLFWDLDVKDAIFESMMYIVIAGLGFTASEKFSKSKKNDE
jgi:hypothetical protein